MTTHDHAPTAGLASGPHFGDRIPDSVLQSYLADALHLTLEEHGAYVALRDLIQQFGVRAVLDDHALICRVLHCTRKHWHDDLGPALVPLLDVYPGEQA